MSGLKKTTGVSSTIGLAEGNLDREPNLSARKGKWPDSHHPGASLSPTSHHYRPPGFPLEGKRWVQVFTTTGKLQFFQSGQEGVIMTLKEDTRDAGVICAFYPEHLDTGELLKELAPRDTVHQGIGVHLVKLEFDTEFLHGGKPL